MSRDPILWAQKPGGYTTHTFAYHDAANPSDDFVVVTASVGQMVIENNQALAMVTVADEAARYALTIATVQNGDYVWQTDTEELWLVIDDTNLGNAFGWGRELFTPTANAHAIWGNLLGLNPDTDPPKGFNDVTFDPGDVDTIGGPFTFYMKRTAATGLVGAQPGWPACGMPIPVRFTFDLALGGTVTAEIAGGAWLSNAVTVGAGDTATMSRVQLPWIT